MGFWLGENFQLFFCHVVFFFAEAADDFVPLRIHLSKLVAILILEVAVAVMVGTVL